MCALPDPDPDPDLLSTTHPPQQDPPRPPSAGDVGPRASGLARRPRLAVLVGANPPRRSPCRVADSYPLASCGLSALRVADLQSRRRPVCTARVALGAGVCGMCMAVLQGWLPEGKEASKGEWEEDVAFCVVTEIILWRGACFSRLNRSGFCVHCPGRSAIEIWSCVIPQ
ncbi:unnamed protein product [Diplocarpon coronariae]